MVPGPSSKRSLSLGASVSYYFKFEENFKYVCAFTGITFKKTEQNFSIVKNFLCLREQRVLIYKLGILTDP